MPYLGQRPSKGDENNFKILDNISSYTLTFDGSDSSVVSAANDTITSLTHRFVQGQRVTYNKGGGTVIAGLSDGVYYIIKEDHNTIKLATSASNAANGTAVNITGVGAGSSHTLNVAFDGVNTKFKATHTNGQKARITRSAQLVISINGVIQQPHDTATPSTGFGFDLDGTIVFSQAPVSTDEYWAHVLTNNNVTFDISNNDIDNFTGDGSTTEFNLSKSPPDNRNVLVTIDGVVQYPNDPDGTVRAYVVVENVLTFNTAPASGVEIQVRHIGFAGSTSGSAGVTNFYGRTGSVVLKNTDNIVANNAEFAGNLTVQGTMTTLDTKVTEVDQLEVAANNTTVGVAITQSGSGDILNLYDGSTEVLTVKDGGNVGIGSDNPTKKLEVYVGSSSIKVKGNDDGSFHIDPNSTGGTQEALIGQANGDLRLLSGAGSYQANRANILLKNSNKDVIINADAPTGKVGIGTATPTSLLTLGASANPSIDFKDYTNNARALITGSAGGQLVFTTDIGNVNANSDFIFRSDSQTNEIVRFKDSGEVGIGTNSPQTKLHLRQAVDNNTDGFRISRVNSNASYSQYIDTSARFNIGYSNPSTADPDPQITLDQNGNVGISTNTPESTLDVVSTITPTGITARTVSTQATDTNKALRVRNNSTTETFNVSYKGLGYFASKLGVGTTTPGAKIEVYGTDAGITVHNQGESRGGIVALQDQRLGLVSTHVNDDLVFGYTNNPPSTANLVERMRIDSGTGNVGIGSTIPAAKLDIRGGGVHSVTNGGKALHGIDINVPTVSPWRGGAISLGAGGDGRSAIAAYQDGTDHDVTGLAFLTHPSDIGTDDNVERLRITPDGQVGLNKLYPKEWHGTYKTIQLFDGGYVAGSADDSFVAIGANNYLNLSSSYAYTNSDFASQLYQVDGLLVFRNAASGTANGSITWSERFRIDSDGQVQIGSGTIKGGGHLTIRGGGVNTYACQDYQYVGTPSNNTTTLAQIRFTANTTGASVLQGAKIQAVSDAAWSATGDAPTRLEFHTSPDGSASMQERLRIGKDGMTTLLNFNGTGFKLQGSNGDYQGIQLQVTDASSSQTRNVFIDAVNENGVAIANQVGTIQSDGGSEWRWDTQPAGTSRTATTGRVTRVRITSAGNIGIGVGPTAGDLETGDSQNIPVVHVKGSLDSATGGEYNLLGRFEAGGDADNTGAMVVLNHSNDRGLAIQGGRSVGNRSYGALKSIDNVGRLTNAMVISGGNGYGVDYIALYTGEATSTTSRLHIDAIGRVGVGTISPVARLTVFDGDNPCIRSGATTFRVDQNASNWTNLPNKTGPILSWDYKSGPGDLMYMGSGGNTGFGTQMALVISDGHGFKVGRSGYDGTDFDVDSSNEHFRIGKDGHVNIGGNFSATGHTLQVTSITGGDAAKMKSTGGDILSLESTTASSRSTIKLITNGNDWEIGARGSSGNPNNTFYIYDNNASDYRFQISENGHILAPNNVAFSARGGPSDVTTNVIIFGTIVFQRGGTNYDTSTGVFTAPVDGIYHFMCNPYRYQDSNDSAILLQKSTDGGSNWTDEIEIRNMNNYNSGSGADSGRGWFTLSLSNLIDLNSSDKVRIKAINRVHTNGIFSRFSGFLVA